MVDKALYIGNTGAKESMRQLEVITNNLANVTKTGFRADYPSKAPYNLNDDPTQSRTYSVTGKTYSDFTSGPVVRTERDLDIAISGKGFLSIQNNKGKEGYTRDGSLVIKDGILKTRRDEIVLGTGGVVSIPANAERFSIGTDGTVSVKVKGEQQLVTIDKIKLTNPDISQLAKSDDGLFYLPGETAAPHDDNVRIVTGALEGSNVNPVETLTSLIEVSRDFEMHSNLMKTIQENATKANEILAVPT